VTRPFLLPPSWLIRKQLCLCLCFSFFFFFFSVRKGEKNKSCCRIEGLWLPLGGLDRVSLSVLV
jgi:hypothetical protein